MSPLSSSEGVRVLSTLAHGLKVIAFLRRGRSTVAEISDGVGLPRQTVYRLLKTAIAEGWVEHLDGSDGYQLSTQLWEISVASFKYERVRDEYDSVVNGLADSYGETVHLAVIDRGSVLYINKAEGSEPIRSYTELGGRAPVHCVATGKCLLSVMPDWLIDRALSEPLERFTSTTLTDAELLRAELREVARAGYAVNRGEWREGVAGVAVLAARLPDGSAASLGFSGPAARVLPRAAELVSALHSAVTNTAIGRALSPDDRDSGVVK